MGAGKTTLVDFLRARYGVTPCFEPNDENPYLRPFYADMKRWAFPSQIYFLQKKFALHLQLERMAGVVVQDRSIYEDAEIFARNLHRLRILDERDFRTYWELYTSIQTQLQPPDLLIYLRCSVRTVRKRIAMRSRPGEDAAPLAYIRGLNQLYEDWFTRYTLSPSIVIPTDNLDYLTDLVHRIDLLDTIGHYLE